MSPPAPPRVLLVEDDPRLSASMAAILRDQGLDVRTVGSAEEALSAVATGAPEVVLTDLRLPGRDGLQLLDALRAGHPRLPVILMTAHGSTATAIEATKRGAYDYLVKPCDPTELLEMVGTAVESARLMTEPVRLPGEEGDPGGALAIVGQSRTLQGLGKEIGRVAGTDLPVLILGETGTGKELVARALYQHGRRAAAPFLAVNCAALPETLLESELFGHERGAFTGADRRRIGRFEQVQGGTLFLDEVGDLAPPTQAKLLRVLQDGTFQRVGGSETLRADVRILAATHRDLEREVVLGGGFREDLYFRLSTVVLRLPPLRERLEDLPALVSHLLARAARELGHESPGISAEAVEELARPSWPGNIRQLDNVLRQALVQARPRPIGLEHLRRILAGPRAVAAAVTATATAAGAGPAPAERTHREYVRDLLERVRRGEAGPARAQLLSDLEPELFLQAIRLARGNQAQAARWLGVTRLKVRETLRQLGWDPADLDGPAGGPSTPGSAERHSSASHEESH